MRTLALIAVGGACGAVARFAIGNYVQKLAASSFPFGTLVVNVVGCFLLGLLLQLAEDQNVPAFMRPLVGVGFLGALTTFSTFGYDTVRCFQRSPISGVANVGLNLAVGVAAVVMGIGVAKLLSVR